MLMSFLFGLVLNPLINILGTFPDGKLLTNMKEIYFELVEVKWPYRYRNADLKSAALKFFFKGKDTKKRPEENKKQKYVHKQSEMESQRNAAYIKNIKKQKKNAIDISITQMMVGKQWVKR